MEHLPIHIADETLLGGPVHYRWMYPFERFIHRMKKMVGNKSKVEESIVNAYIQIETSFLGDEYLGLGFKTNSRRPQRNEVNEGVDDYERASIYNYPGRSGSICTRRILGQDEFRKAVHYVLTNMPEFEEYLNLFYTETREQHPDIDEGVMYHCTLTTFPTWLREHVWELGNTHVVYEWIHDVAMGFDGRVTCCTTYKVNNYKFHTESHSEGRPTVNCNVSVQGTEGSHYYGVIEEIIQLRCRSKHQRHVTLFKCRWFDLGHVRTYPSFSIVQVNTNKLYSHYDPFVLAQQAVQVYFADFPGFAGHGRDGLVAVCRVKPTNSIEMTVSDIAFQDDGEQDSQMPPTTDVEPLTSLADDVGYEYATGDTCVDTESEQSSPSEISDNETE